MPSVGRYSSTVGRLESYCYLPRSGVFGPPVNICKFITFTLHRAAVNSKVSVRSAEAPPSSSEAFENLFQFALLHNLGNQFLLALTTAITFPTHGTHKTTIQLPLAVLSETHQLVALATSIPPEWRTLENELPFYIALSRNTAVLMSSLCGMFWQPEITCDMVSPWLHPILNEVPFANEFSGTPGFYPELLGIMCTFRQPRISSLWLSAVASGLTSVVIRRIRRGRPPLDPNAFPWTGCPQSFMDVAGTGTYVYVRRHCSKSSRMVTTPCSPCR